MRVDIHVFDVDFVMNRIRKRKSVDACLSQIDLHEHEHAL